MRQKIRFVYNLYKVTGKKVAYGTIIDVSYNVEVPFMGLTLSNLSYKAEQKIYKALAKNYAKKYAKDIFNENVTILKAERIPQL